MARILIVDDDQLFCEMLAHKVELMGHLVEVAHTLNGGLTLATKADFDVVLMDVRLPDGSGLGALDRLKVLAKPPEVIIITGAGDPDGAELAIKSGAWDYIKKPSSMESMTLPLIRALQYRRERESSPRPVALMREGIVGDSPGLRFCLDQLAAAAASEGNLLLSGETGTGKELFARAIHANSRRASAPLVVVDCSTLPANLVESILFGHEKGVFTGAHQHREGLIARANGGTLFLDEVGELPLMVQKSFLRVLQERRFRPLGSGRETASDFRLISATNRNLDDLAYQGGFREDLLHRLRTLHIRLPPLRERKEDIEPLARHYTDLLIERYGMDGKGFAPEFTAALETYRWPGNVRELINTLERALTDAGSAPTLFTRHLSQTIRVSLARASLGMTDAREDESQKSPQRPLPDIRTYRRSMDTRYLKELIGLTHGDMDLAARISGLSRSRLYGLMKNLRLGKDKGVLLSHKEDDYQ